MLFRACVLAVPDVRAEEDGCDQLDGSLYPLVRKLFELNWLVVLALVLVGSLDVVVLFWCLSYARNSSAFCGVVAVACDLSECVRLGLWMSGSSRFIHWAGFGLTRIHCPATLVGVCCS